MQAITFHIHYKFEYISQKSILHFVDNVAGIPFILQIIIMTEFLKEKKNLFQLTYQFVEDIKVHSKLHFANLIHLQILSKKFK